MKIYTLFISSILCLALFFINCGKDTTPIIPNPPTNNNNGGIIQDLNVLLNPSTYAPLSAKLEFSTNKEVTIRLKVNGKNGAASDVIREFTDLNMAFSLPVLGLYPSFQNKVELALMDENGMMLSNDTLTIATPPLTTELPVVRIEKADVSMMTPGWNLVNYAGYNRNRLPQKAFMFDEFGDIRWYVDYSEHPKLSDLIYEVGLSRLQNGHFIFGDKNSNAIYEIDMFGDIVNNWDLNDYIFHHTVIEKPNGNLLLTASEKGQSTIEDIVLEIDRTSNTIIRKWGLRESLDRFRQTWDTDLGDINKDWFHGNAIAFDEKDNAIIVSGRTQGIVKLTENNEVIWILAPHKDWKTSANGLDLNEFLLQPLDAEGLPITDLAVLEGTTNHPDFEWAWYQHAPFLMPNGNLLVFYKGRGN